MIEKGKIQTVLGLIDKEDLGVTLMHEHLLHDMSIYFKEPREAGERFRAHQPVTLENLNWVKRNDTKNLDNLQLTDENLAIKEMGFYKIEGGESVIEVTSQGPFGRDPAGLRRISRASGLHLVMGTGFDAFFLREPSFDDRSDDDITGELVNDIEVGADGTDIQAGIIGEIGCSILNESEVRVLRCCAEAQQQTGAAIYIHSSPTDEQFLQIGQILADAGAEPSKCVLGHVDLFGFSLDAQRRAADMGFILGYDNFGFNIRQKFPGNTEAVELSDLARYKDISTLCAEGYAEHIVLAHDLAVKCRLESYGGHGYAHILREAVPILLDKGVTKAQIRAMLVDNPANILAS